MYSFVELMDGCSLPSEQMGHPRPHPFGLAPGESSISFRVSSQTKYGTSNLLGDDPELECFEQQTLCEIRCRPLIFREVTQPSLEQTHRISHQ
jgi:hypothetical protein